MLGLLIRALDPSRPSEIDLVAQRMRLACASTWTSSTNTPLIELYPRLGYAEAERGQHPETGTLMVRLERNWQPR